MADGKKKKSGKKTGPDWSWILFIFVITMVISAAMSFISSRLLGNAGMAVSFLILICIVAIGIVFDIIGVAVTACPEAPFHAMASRKVAEAPDALKLLRNANRVSSFCNDVIGDICGVISGSAAAVIAARAVLGMESTKATIVTLGMSALVAAVTVGGKATAVRRISVTFSTSWPSTGPRYVKPSVSKSVVPSRLRRIRSLTLCVSP